MVPECPVSNLYAPGLIELEKTFRGKQVQFLAIYSNENEDLEQMAIHAGDRDFPFPVLKNSGQRLAELVGAARVPTVAVLDGDFKVRIAAGSAISMASPANDPKRRGATWLRRCLKFSPAEM